MIALHIQSINRQQDYQRFHCVLNQLEEALTTLSLIAAAGNTLLEVYIVEDGQRTNLPPQAFDGQDMNRPIRALQAGWVALLSQPTLGQSLQAQRQLLLELTLQRLDQCETLMGEYDESLRKLENMIGRATQTLRSGPRRDRLLLHYQRIVIRQHVSMQQAEADRDNWLKNLTRLKQV